jgi:hypothetical protein
MATRGLDEFGDFKPWHWKLLGKLMPLVFCSWGAGRRWRDGITRISWRLASIKPWTFDCCLILRLILISGSLKS